MSHWPPTVTLEGEHVRLVPLSPTHEAGLIAAVRDGDLHRLWYTTIPAPDDVAAEITRRLSLRETGWMLPFTVFNGEGQIVGMTTFMNIDAVNRRVEIGSTWYARSVQRTPLNTQAKRLLLSYAFDELDCIGVELRTHVLNQQSRKAIERLGAKFDGVLRAHMIMPNGTVRDTACYSITAAEWPVVRANLDWQLEKPR
ncbi:MAG: GNAT family protein [Pseudomonadota bacterium]